MRDLTPPQMLAACEALLTGTTHADEPSDGPPERVIAEADCDYFADREEAREQRWRDSA